MQENKLYRTLFLLDDTRNYTNDFYLTEFAKIVLFRDPSALDIDGLKAGIEELTTLEYTEEDIEHAIAMNGRGQITFENGLYSLTKSAFDELAKRDKTNYLKSFISEFLSANPGKYEISIERAEELIDSFIFQRFNENLQQISEILNRHVSILAEENDYEESEAAFINDFLNWNNTAKNKCVFQLISNSYDYFMINSKCEDPAFDFSTMNFYVDTNILFRLMGLNGKLRESSVRSLIDKCRSVGIRLIVSNYVRAECETTIDKLINVLIDYTTDMSNVIPPSSMSFAEEQSARLDFYTKYYHWVKSGNKHRNYDAFKKYLHRELDDLLKGFTHDNGNVSYKTKPESGFSSYCDALKSIKKEKHTTETDVNSFLLVRDKRAMDPQQSYYLISADSHLISWLWDTFPGEKSIADYPSAWLSIILKYSGREKDTDYKAFCQLVHLSIHPQVEDLEKKLAVKADIVYSDLDERIQVEMIDEVRNHYSQYKDLPESKIVRYSYAKSIERIEKDAEHRIREESDKIIDSLEQKLKNKEEESESKIAEIQKQREEEKARIIAEKDSEKQSAVDTERANTIAKMKAQDIHATIERNKQHRHRLTKALLVLFVVTLALWTFFLFKGQLSLNSQLGSFFENNALYFAGAGSLITGIIFCLRTLFANKIFPIDEKVVAKQIDEKYDSKNT
ncbi:hypothetical protein [uncultured Ruminococcus sp.]|uniref:hypothetical protein n=1 Tax=uncultured Ruminococcus sp. TaxID=165186 RepID=UPI00293032A7|nr:hypothetical protein [uncultured Ruminococcus sp.]